MQPTFKNLQQPLLDALALTICPPVVYRLPEGKKISAIEVPKYIKDWRFNWFGTNGRDDQGVLCLIPTNRRTRKLLQEGRLTFYKKQGFLNIEAEVLSRMNVKDYHDPKKMIFIKTLIRDYKMLDKGLNTINGLVKGDKTVREVVAEFGHDPALKNSSLVDAFKVVEQLLINIEAAETIQYSR